MLFECSRPTKRETITSLNRPQPPPPPSFDVLGVQIYFQVHRQQTILWIIVITSGKNDLKSKLLLHTTCQIIGLLQNQWNSFLSSKFAFNCFAVLYCCNYLAFKQIKTRFKKRSIQFMKYKRTLVRNWLFQFLTGARYFYIKIQFISNL